MKKYAINKEFFVFLKNASKTRDVWIDWLADGTVFERGFKNSLPKHLKDVYDFGIRFIEPPLKLKPEENKFAQDVLDYLNSQIKTSYKLNETNLKFINGRKNEGAVLEDFKKVIDNKVKDWVGTDWEKFLRPQTLFGNKFEGYLNAQIKNNKTNENGKSTYHKTADAVAKAKQLLGKICK